LTFVLIGILFIYQQTEIYIYLLSIYENEYL